MTTPSPRTVRVRVAVVADSDCRWAAFGADQARDEVMANELSGVVGEPSRLTYIEADIPLPPEPEAVEGEVAS